MEKFFIVQDGCALYKDYFAWKKNSHEQFELINGFLLEHGILANLYLDSKEQLAIVPTNSDLEQFRTQFTATAANGLRFFRRNSAIGKAWREFSKNRTVLYKPCPSMYLNDVCGSFRTRLFDYNGVLYCSVESENDFTFVGDGYKEIKGSEFYKIMEDMTDD